MCKVYKLSQKTDSETNPYVFQSFNIPYTEKAGRESSSLEVSDIYYRKIERLEQKNQNLKIQADLIIKRAEAEAEKIIERANRKAVDVLNASSEEGYKKGLSIANKKTDEVIRDANSKAIEILHRAKQNSEKIINELEEHILDFSFDIVKKILDVELDRNDEAFSAIINKALSEIRIDTAARIIMQADDLKRLENNGIHKVLTDGGKLDLHFVSDNDINKGDIIFETERGMVDAGVSSQFSRIKSAFLQECVSAL